MYWCIKKLFMTKYFSEKELEELLSNKDFYKVLKDSGSKPVSVTIDGKRCLVERCYKVEVVEDNTDDLDVDLHSIKSILRTKK